MRHLCSALVSCITLFNAFVPCGFAQTYPGNFTGYSVAGKSITVRSDTTSLRFIFYKDDVVRVDFLPTPSSRPDSSFVIVRDTLDNIATSISESDTALLITSAAVAIECRKSPLRLSFRDNAWKVILAEPVSGGLTAFPAARRATFTLGATDHFYGTGERGTSLDKRGQAFDSYNTQVGGYSDPLATMNTNIPFVATLSGYALYFDNTFSGRFDFGVSDQSKFSYTAYGGELTYYMIVAPTIPKQLELYTWLTGRQPLPPRWAFGFIQSKYGYHNETEARTMIQTMRTKGIPCDAIVLDLYWFGNMGDISWNTAAWPQPFTMMSDLLSQGIKTIAITEPYIVSTSANFSIASALGYLATNSAAQPYLLHKWWSCGCDASLLDLTNPSAQSWWWNKHPAFMGSTMAGLWTDLGEPENHPDDMQHHLGPAPSIHNIYNLLWAKTIFDGFHQLRPNDRLLNLTRSGFAGIQRYGVIPWSGDVGRSFGGLAVQLPMVLNMGMSGLVYHNSDIGGFCCGTTTPELYTRWMQYGTFCPITRAHGTGQPTEPWGFDTTTERICKQFLQLRYRLLPYIYTMAHESYVAGLPLARPLIFDDPNDPNLVNESSSYLWGSEFLVSPVTAAGATSKNVYLPSGTWIDYWTEKAFSGGTYVTVAAPIDRMPIFVRSGSIIPMQQDMNYSNERISDTLTLAFYPRQDPTETQFVLYEDDGISLAYQSGTFARTTFAQQLSSASPQRTLTIDIGISEGSYSGKPAHRAYICDIHTVTGRPKIVYSNTSSLPEHHSFFDLRQSGDGFYFDSVAHRLFIQIETIPESSYHITAENMEVTGAQESHALLPVTFDLAQNFPNPLNPGTSFRFSILDFGMTTLKVYDLLGRTVATIVDEHLPPGSYTRKWDASYLPSGIYFYRLQSNQKIATRKLAILK